jgi:hypothetical protein
MDEQLGLPFEDCENPTVFEKGAFCECLTYTIRMSYVTGEWNQIHNDLLMRGLNWFQVIEFFDLMHQPYTEKMTAELSVGGSVHFMPKFEEDFVSATLFYILPH